jgi:HK97 family phage prohead protease
MRTTEGAALPTISGYAAVFNEVSEDLGWFYEKIEPGFFSSCLLDPDLDVACLKNHDDNLIVARLSKPSSVSTLSVRQDDRGLYCEFTPADTTVGRDLVTDIKAGNINGMSFSFITDEDSWSDTYNGKTLRRLLSCQKLIDVAPCVFPAYLGTSIAAARSIGGEIFMSLEDYKARSRSTGSPEAVPFDILRKKLDLAGA